MKTLKNSIRKLLPENFYNSIVLPKHYLAASLAVAKNGYPAKDMEVIAVTGTNGKTTTITLLASILEAAGHKVGVSSTAFFRIGDKTTMNDLNMTVTNPFALQSLLKDMKNADVDYVLLEVTSHALMQKRVLGVQPKVAIMTNLTQDHLDYHGTMENYAKAKSKLFAMKPDFIILNRDDKWYDYFNKFKARKQSLTYGKNKESNICLTDVKLNQSSSKLVVEINGESLKIDTNLSGEFNAYNTLAASAAANALSIENKSIVKGLANLQSVPGRMQRLDFGQKYNIFVDYAHTPDALEKVLTTLQDITKGKVIIVFGATGDRDRSKRPTMGKIMSENADITIITDDEPYTEDPASIRQSIEQGITSPKAKIYNIGNRRKAINKALKLAKAGDSIILAGIGNQSYRVIGSQKQPWQEHIVAQEEFDRIN